MKIISKDYGDTILLGERKEKDKKTDRRSSHIHSRDATCQLGIEFEADFPSLFGKLTSEKIIRTDQM